MLNPPPPQKKSNMSLSRGSVQFTTIATTKIAAFYSIRFTQENACQEFQASQMYMITSADAQNQIFSYHRYLFFNLQTNYSSQW